jgi:hypothetical protein
MRDIAIVQLVSKHGTRLHMWGTMLGMYRSDHCTNKSHVVQPLCFDIRNMYSVRRSLVWKEYIAPAESDFVEPASYIHDSVITHETQEYTFNKCQVRTGLTPTESDMTNSH